MSIFDHDEVRRDLNRRRKLTRKNTRREVIQAAALGLLVLGGGLAVFATFLAIGALIFLVAWNVGVVAIVSAAGGSVSKIGFWAALGGSLAVGIVRRIFARDSKVEVQGK